jgi:hypothetical protein
LAVAPSLSHRTALTSLRYLRSIHFQLSIIHYQLSVGSVLCQSGYTAKGGCLLFFCRRFIYASFRFVPLNSRIYGGVFDCRNSAPHPQKKVPCPLSGAPLLLLACLGCLIAAQTRTPLRNNNNDSAFFRKKEKNPANLASIPHFQSVHRNMFQGSFKIYLGVPPFRSSSWNGSFLFSFRKLRSNYNTNNTMPIS